MIVSTLASIKSPDDVCYLFLLEFQHQSFHCELLKIIAEKNAAKQLLEEGQFRNINVNLSDLLVPTYEDEHSNFVFRDIHLK